MTPVSRFDPEAETFDSAGSSTRAHEWAMRGEIDTQLIKLSRHVRGDGEISVLEPLPFLAERLFVITANKGTVRGNHAHRRCSQYVACASGAVDVIVDNGIFKRGTYRLEAGESALWIPPLTWTTVVFCRDAVVNVLCNRPYEEEDYIRDYSEFLSELRDDAHRRPGVTA